MLINPYVVGHPVGDSPAFFGRADVLSEVLRVLHHPQNNAIVLYGQRRIGKTSILQELETKLPHEGAYFLILFDLQNKATCPLAEVLEELAYKISEALKQEEPNLGKKPEIAFRQWLSTVLPTDTSLVLLFDEFDALEDHKAKQASTTFFPYLQELLNVDPKHLNFVFVIGRKIDDLKNTLSLLKEVTTTKRISLLEHQDTVKLIRFSENNNSLYWSNDAIEKIWQLTNGHPYLTQHLCSRVWENIDKNKSDEAPTVNDNDVEAAIVDTLANSRSALEWLWDGLPPAERVVASALAEAGAGEITEKQLKNLLRENGLQVFISKLQDAPRVLQEWDLIEQVKGGSYHFRVELLRRWITDYKPLHSVQEELDRIQPIADNYYQIGLSHYHGRELEEALNVLYKAIRINPNHVKATQLLADILLENGELDEAIERLERLYKSQPKAARTKLVHALLISAQENESKEEQLNFYKKILALESEHTEAKEVWRLCGDEAYKDGDLETALNAYQITNLSHKITEVQEKIRLREFKAQLKVLKKLEQGKRYVETLEVKALEKAKQLADEYSDKRDWIADLERLEKQLEKQVELSSELYKKARSALAEGDINNAQVLSAQVIASEPTYEEAVRYLYCTVTGVDAVEQMVALEKDNRQRKQEVAQLKKEIAQIKDELTFEKQKRYEYKKKEIKNQIKHNQELEKNIQKLNTKYKAIKNFIIILIILTVVALVFFNLYPLSLLPWFKFLPVVVIGLLLVLIPFLGPWLKIRAEDKGRDINLVIFDAVTDPNMVNARQIPIAGHVNIDLDGQIRVMDEEKPKVAKQFRITRLPISRTPAVKVQYSWQGSNKKYTLILTGKMSKPLEGISGNSHIVTLRY
jgi:tetratricopeptide (TPR) repeat protein